jgi:hypothetical protein
VVTARRSLSGIAVSAYGVIALIGHDGPIVLALALIAGGAAVPFGPVARAGGLVAAAAYLVTALMCVPQIVAAPAVYNSWGNLFEQLAMGLGGALIWAYGSSRWTTAAVRRAGSIVLGACAASFALEQAFYLNNTAVLVPVWLPPDRLFWAVATTVAFAAAAVALFADRLALLATRLLTAMLALSGFAVWVPQIVADPRSLENWSEGAETFAIAGTAWIVAGLLDRDVRRRA